MTSPRLSFGLLTVIVGCLLLPPRTAAAQPAQSPSSARLEGARPDSTLVGIVWAPPSSPGPALLELNRIAASGATAVRLSPPLPADTVFARADSLNVKLFVDLPVSYVSASPLRDSLAAADSTRARLLALAQRHPSIHAVGLARYADTTVPSACSALEEMSARVHDRAPDLLTYYVTPFTASADQCRDAVDRPLLDLRGHPAPLERWAEWRETGAEVGLAALGTWTAPGADAGLHVPHSPQRQARYLERALGRLLDSTRAAPPPVFVHRWTDDPSPTLSSRRYGLHDADGTRRPAARVVEGFYRGTQRVFAFPSGTAPTDTPVGPLIVGWGLLALLGGLYARNPFVRQTVSRYFAAHGFYRDAVEKGRNVRPTENGILLLSVAVAVGTIGTLAARMAGAPPLTEWIVAALPSPVSTSLAVGLTQPVLTGLVVGAVAFGLLVGWALCLFLAARIGNSLSLAQCVMLVTWPCWPAFLGLPVALVAATHPPFPPQTLGLVLAVGGAVTLLAVTLRTLLDYVAVTGKTALWTPVLLALSPFVLTSLAAGLLVSQYDLPLSLLWHLLTRT